MRHVPAALLLVVGLAGAERLSAIVIRHDVSDDRYRAMAARFPAVGHFGRAGTGTLVAPSWVLTAAHVASRLRSATFTLGERPYAIQNVTLHPDWKAMGPHDIALVRLAAPVADVPPLTLYERDDEAGREVVFVGHGGTGNGVQGVRRDEDGLKRAATNRVDRVDADWLFFTFDPPESASELEGISGPGDSGGPALIQLDGVYRVAGVSVWGKPGARGRGTYGAQEGYTRVSAHVRWLADTMR